MGRMRGEMSRAAGVNHSGEQFDETYCDKINHPSINRSKITSPGLLFSLYDVREQDTKTGCYCLKETTSIYLIVVICVCAIS